MTAEPTEASSEIRPASEGMIADFRDYKPLRKHGAMQLGTVTGFGHLWFVKSLCEPYRDITQFRQALIKEYDILVSLRRGPVADAISLCEIDGAGLSIVMEYIPGVHLDKYLEKAPGRLRKKVLRRLVDAVAYIHAHGVAHLDLKPENILIHGSTENPEVCLIDFNLSDTQTLTYNKEGGGNRRYAAPEQLRPDYVGSPRADVWSLALLLKEFGAGASWRHAISRALSNDPLQRPADASAMIRLQRNSKLYLSLFIAFLLTAFLAISLLLIIPRHSENIIPANTTEPSGADTATSISAAQPTEAGATVQTATNPGQPVAQITEKPTPTIGATEEAKQPTPVATGSELAPYIKAHTLAVAMTKKNLSVIEKELINLYNDTTIPAKRRYPNAILIQRMNSAWNPLLHLRDTTPPHILKKLPPTWGTFDDDDMTDTKQRIGRLMNKF